jgi:hypothetical protein
LLSASFLARNSDLWFHLATGRLLAQGQFTFGADPFAYTTREVYWSCHSWLFDLGLYELDGLVGGGGLVVLKALFIAALAGLLLRVRRPSSGAWLPVICTTLAIVAMSPRLLLQPACVSYGFLGLTFWLLWKSHQDVLQIETRGTTAFPPICNRQSKICILLLPLLFALWVNVDEWFFLGPVLTALFWFGERLQGQKRTPGWVVPAGLAACLLNPYTFHAFTLPSELSAALGASELRQDVRFQAIFASPWSWASLRTSGSNPVALAYFALTFLGLISFLLNWRALLGWRLVVWLPFALLAAWQARTIPFFAVVAAPITALNSQDFLAGRQEIADSTLISRRRLGFQPAICILQSAILLALIYFTWAGWQVGGGRESRHVAWGVQADPSLQQVAETLHDWRQRGLLPDGERVFAVSLDVAQYGAWFSPGEEHFLDQRYQLYHEAAQDYEVVCRALLPGLEGEHRARPWSPDQGRGQETTAQRGDWQQVLREHDVSVVVFSDRDPQRLFAVLHRLANDPEWTLLDVSGQALIFGWNEARSPGGFSLLAFDADRLAFGSQDERAPHVLPAAPEHGPEHLSPRRDYWDRLTRPPASPSRESAAASMYLHYSDDLHNADKAETSQRQKRLQSTMSGYAASLAGLPALPSALPQAVLQLLAGRNILFPPGKAPAFLVREQLGPFFAPLVERPPALPLLAIRAARQAVAANPEDSNAWFRLGHAYLLLRNETCERSAEGLLPPLAQLRYVQIVNALEQAVRLDPDLETAHHELASLYGQQNYVDKALEHQREELRLIRRAGARQDETAEEFADRSELWEKDTAGLDELVQDRRKTFVSASRTLQGGRMAEAAVALKLGLGRQALEEILLPYPADVLGEAGRRLELELLLMQGRAEDVRANLSEEALRDAKNQQRYYTLGPPQSGDGSPLYASFYDFPAYTWLHLLQAAALGDYSQARDELREIRSRLYAAQDLEKQRQRALEGLLVTLVPRLISGPPPLAPAVTAQTLGPIFLEISRSRAVEPTFRGQRADLFVVEGLLDLEQGHVDAARSAFTQAQQLCAEPAGGQVRFGGGPIAASYLGKLNAQTPR